MRACFASNSFIGQAGFVLIKHANVVLLRHKPIVELPLSSVIINLDHHQSIIVRNLCSLIIISDEAYL